MAANVAIRLGTSGAAQVKSDFADMGTAGEQSARRYQKAYEQASAGVEAALARQERAQRNLALLPGGAGAGMAQRGAEVWAGNAAIGKSAQDSASVFEAAFLRMEQRAQALVAAIDPVYAAQLRANQVIGSAKELFDQGVLSGARYQQILDGVEAELQQVTVAQGRQGASAGQLRSGMQQLSYQVGDVAQQFALGTPPMIIFAQQGGQVLQAVQLMTNSTKGFIGFLAGPWGAALTGGAILLAALGAKYFESADASEVMKNRQQELAKIIDFTTGRIKEQNHALLNNSILQGRKIEQDSMAAYRAARSSFINYNSTIPGVAGIQADYAAGRINASGAGDRLAKATAGYEYGSAGFQQMQQLQNQLIEANSQARNFLSAQAGNRLVTGQGRPGDLKTAQGNFDRYEAPNTTLLDAQAKLAAATTTLDRAQANLTITREKAQKQLDNGQISQAEYVRQVSAAEAAVNGAQKSVDRHGASLGRNAAAMEYNAASARDLAKAYLEGGDAALKAEAARKGGTDALRKGIEGEAQIRRQLAIMVGDALVSGAKSLDQMREETAAREDVLAQVRAGTLGVKDMNRALEREMVLRPLLKLATVAQGEDLALITRLIREQTAAIEKRDQVAASSAVALKNLSAREQIDETKAKILDMKLDPRTQALNAARRAAERDADAKQATPDERREFIRLQMEVASAQYAEQRAEQYKRARDEAEDALQLGYAELQLMGSNDNYREREIAKLSMILAMRREGKKVTDEDFQQRLRDFDAIDAMNRKIAEQAQAWDNIREIGGNAIDTLFDIDNWDDWGAAGKRILRDLANDFLRLAAINPLKNALFGSNLPTGAGIFGALFGAAAGGLGGGAGGVGGGASGFGAGMLKLAGNSTGTAHWTGGMMLAGENGPEIVSAPRGSQVFNAADSRRMMAAHSGAPSISMPISIHALGADAAALERVERELAELKESLPARVVEAWTDARQRMVIR